LAEAGLPPLALRRAEPDQKESLLQGPLVPMMLCWSPLERRWMRRLHQARRASLGCAEGDAQESQSPQHDRRRMLKRVNLGCWTRRSCQWTYAQPDV